MNRIRIFGLFFALIFSVISFGCGNQNKLCIYSIIHEEETGALTKLFTKQTGIKTYYLRANTGELVNRIIAEKDNPQADILLGGATNYHLLAQKAGALEPYVSPLAANVPEYAKSPDGLWTGFCVLTLGIGVNTPRFTELFPGTPVPKTWDDLVNPAFKGEIVLTNPVASSTAYLFLQNQLQRLGEKKGWEYLLRLASLAGQFPDSGNAPAQLIGTGEYALGISYLHMLAKYKSEGFTVDLVAPPKSVGDVDCIAITKNARHLEQAKRFVDFMLSKEAQELMSSIDFTIPVNPEAKPATGSIPLSQIDLIDYDADKAAKEKETALSYWVQNVK